MPAPAAADIAKTFALEHAITVKGLLYSELNARRPKVKDLRVMASGAEKDGTGAYVRFLAGLCTVPPDVIDELDLADFAVVKEWVASFLPKPDEQTS